ASFLHLAARHPNGYYIFPHPPVRAPPSPARAACPARTARSPVAAGGPSSPPTPSSITASKSSRRTLNEPPLVPRRYSAIASSVAFLQTLSRSAPVNPSVRAAIASRSTSFASGT